MAQCYVFSSFRFANLGALDLALVGFEHGFLCDMGLQTMAGLCCLGLFFSPVIAVRIEVVGWAWVHRVRIVFRLQVLTQLLIRLNSC
jgi:hypothetical protein